MQFARIVGASVGVAAAIVTTCLFTSLPASAHTPDVKASCVDDKPVLDVKLTAYKASERGKTNTVKITDNGKSIEDKNFETEFSHKYTGEKADVEHVFVVDVKAWDSDNFSFTKTLTVTACVKAAVVVPTTVPQTTTTVPTVPSTPGSSVEATSESATTTTSPAVVPVAAKDELANTGASIAIPLVIGVVLLGGGAALLLVLRRRANN